MEKVSQLMGKMWSKTQIGEVAVSVMFAFEIKTIVREGDLWVYFVERDQKCDRIVRYNCSTKQR